MEKLANPESGYSDVELESALGEIIRGSLGSALLGFLQPTRK